MSFITVISVERGYRSRRSERRPVTREQQLQAGQDTARAQRAGWPDPRSA